MVYSYTYTFMECQTCTAKIHCEVCAERIVEAVKRQEDLRILSLDEKQKELSVETAGMDEDHIVDILEDAGIFV